MNLDDLLQAVQELLSADSPEAVMRVIQNHPDPLREEAIDQLHQLAQKAKAMGHAELAEALTTVAELLEQLQRELLPSQLSEAESKPTISLSHRPSVQWARLTRQYLALRKDELLQQAVEAAVRAGETSIANLLRAFQALDIKTINRLAPPLHHALRQAGREEEAWTVALVHLDTRARLAEQFMRLPLEQQMEALKVGLKACEEAVAIARALGDEPCVAVYRVIAGNGYYRARRFEEAEGAFREALEIYRRLAKREPKVYEPDLATTLNNLGAVLRNLRRFEEAEGAYREALEIRRRLAEKEPEVYEPYLATSLNNLGLVLSDLRRFEEAERAYREALEIRRRLAEREPQVYEPDLAMTLNNLGAVLSDLRRFEEAEGAFREALEIRRCLAEREPQVYEPNLAGTLNGLGNVLSDLRRFEEAEEAYKEAQKIYQRHDVPDQKAILLSNFGRLQVEQERWEEAVETLREAVAQVERLRAEVLNLDRRERILRENIHIYEHLLICLMKLGRYREALEVAEWGKSRTLIDLLTLRDLRPRNAPPEVVKEYEQMLFRARALEDELRRTEGDGRRREGGRRITAEDWEKVRQELAQTNDRLRELAMVIRGYDPDFLPHAQPLTADEIIALAQDANATLILFRVTEAGSFVFLVFPNGETDVVEVPDFTTEALSELLVKFEDEEASDGWVVRYYEYQAALAEGDRAEAVLARQYWLEKMEETLGTLYQQLLKPVHERLKGWQEQVASTGRLPHLVLVPNRGLAILPLHACWWEENGVRRYLLDEFVIRYAPSLSVFKRCLERERAGRKRETLLGVANPVPPGNLIFSEWECQEIERLIGNQRCLILWREKATEAEVRQWMGERNYLHFSCHGQYRLDAPLESALHLAGGDKLTLGEIFEGVYLPEAWLVVLSACETGLVDFREVADEHFGLPTGFLYAGAPTVYGSLWSVNDLSTALLMAKVYEGLEKGGKSKPDALRDAQIWLRDLTAQEALALVQSKESELLRERMAWADVAPLRRALELTDPNDRPFAHPYHWAAFQCVGV